MALSEHILLLLGVFSVLVYLSRAQECQVTSLKTQDNFDFDKYMGRWYEYEWYSDYNFPKSTWMDDYIHSYIPIGDGNATTYIEGRLTDNGECRYYAGQLQATSSTGKLQFTSWISTIPYWVLETDYTQYAFVYGCFNVSDSGTCNGASAWIFGRTPTVPQIVIDKAPEYYRRICIDKDKFITTNQTNECPFQTHFAVPTDRNCNVSNNKPQESFDVTKYLGTWYETRWLAPANFPPNELFVDYQHHYVMTLDGNITVYVYGRDPTSGTCFYRTAKLVGSDTPGMFAFSAGKVTDPYVVIGTDYKTYSVVYGCQNSTADGNCFKARSWVWSRTPTLSKEFTIRANVLLQSRCVNPAAFLGTTNTNLCPLQQQWAVTKGQECRVDRLQVTSDFNSTMFTGVWYEISWLPETYVTDADLSRDRMNEVFVSGNGDLITYSRLRACGKCRYGKAVYKKTDSSGRYTMGQDASPILMADTDYENYAVVYVCQKQNTTSGECLSSRVYVWGRRTSLTWSQQIKVNSVLQDLCINPSAMSPTLHEKACVPEKQTCPPVSSASSSSTMRSLANAIMKKFLVFLK